jgi:acetyltransferase-like isoleucine patch superfamily enzyme
MKLIIRIGSKLLRLYRLFYYKAIYGSNIMLGDGGKVEIFKYSDFVFESKEARFFIYGDFLARNGFCVRICECGILSIGQRVFFNNYCSITCRRKINIGNDCIFGENVKLYDHNHIYTNIDKSVSEQGYSDGEIIIGNNVWIGSNVVILKDVHIGNNCVVGAGCVVYRNVPDNTIMLSNGSMKIIVR